MNCWHTNDIFRSAEEFSPVQLPHGDRNSGIVWIRDVRPLNVLVLPLNHNSIRAEIVRCHERGRIDEMDVCNSRTSNKCQKWKEELGTHFGREVLRREELFTTVSHSGFVSSNIGWTRIDKKKRGRLGRRWGGFEDVQHCHQIREGGAVGVLFALGLAAT
jgi:hypothetical protein